MTARKKRDVLETAVRSIATRVTDADRLVDEAQAAGHDGLTLQAEIRRLELQDAKADLERELGGLFVECTSCRRHVHWGSGLGAELGNWAHAEPAPHGEPAT